jgi:hypothetical protein
MIPSSLASRSQSYVINPVNRHHRYNKQQASHTTPLRPLTLLPDILERIIFHWLTRL